MLYCSQLLEFWNLGRLGSLRLQWRRNKREYKKTWKIYIYIWIFFLEYNITRKSAKTRCAISTESELIWSGSIIIFCEGIDLVLVERAMTEVPVGTKHQDLLILLAERLIIHSGSDLANLSRSLPSVLARWLYSSFVIILDSTTLVSLGPSQSFHVDVGLLSWIAKIAFKPI